MSNYLSHRGIKSIPANAAYLIFNFQPQPKLNRLFMRLLIIKHLTAYSAPVFHKIFETFTVGLITKSFFYYLKFHRGTHIFLGGEKARKGNMQTISLRR